MATIAQKFAAFAVNRAAAVPLYRFPEELGDLDEFWPGPLSCIERQQSEVSKIDVEWCRSATVKSLYRRSPCSANASATSPHRATPLVRLPILFPPPAKRRTVCAISG